MLKLFIICFFKIYILLSMIKSHLFRILHRSAISVYYISFISLQCNANIYRRKASFNYLGEILQTHTFILHVSALVSNY